MEYVMIENKGEASAEAFTLLGASVKTSDSPIGFFGSGNKYAIALLLRQRYDLQIFSGEEHLGPTVETVNFRGETFGRVLIQGKETSITTRTGPAWETWMALREFVCNAMDEDSSPNVCLVDEEDIVGREGYTRIFIEYRGEVEKAYDNLSDIVVLNHEELAVNSIGGLFLDHSPGVFRRGVACISEDERGNYLFAYNLQNIDITEQRLVKSDYDTTQQIREILMDLKDKALIQIAIQKALIYDGNGAFYNEGCGNSWPYAASFTSEWYDVLKTYPGVFCSASSYNAIPEDDRAVYTPLVNSFYEKIIRQFPSLPHLGADNRVPCAPPKKLKRKIDDARAVVTKLYPIERPFIIKYCYFVSKLIGAQAEEARGKKRATVWVAADLSENADMEAILLEELVHINTQYPDGSRALQGYLFKQLRDALKENKELQEKLEASNAVAV